MTDLKHFFFGGCLLLFITLAGQGQAQHHDMTTCFEAAAYQYVAITAGVDLDTAQILTPILPEGQDMLTSMRQAAAGALGAQAEGVDRNVMITLAQSSMQDTPILAAGVAMCLNQYY